MASEKPSLVMQAALRSLDRESSPANGTFILVEDDTVVTDKVSGNTYVTRAMWDRLRAAIPSKEQGQC